MFEDSDECVQLLNEVKNSELCKSKMHFVYLMSKIKIFLFLLDDNNIMFEDSDDDKLCVQLLDEVENSELCKSMIHFINYTYLHNITILNVFS